MKKSLIVTLALVFVLGIAGTAFAANPFVDVPAKHWSYDAVAKLAQAGIVDGYGDGTFKGDKTMTRYEMATVVAKAMAKSDKANAETKALVDKLAAEYSAELANLGVKVAALEKKAAADTVNITGEARFRYNNRDKDGANENERVNALRTRLHVNGVVNDQWTYGAHFEASNSLYGSADDSATMYNAFAQGPVFGTTATVGRFDYLPNYGLMVDTTINGASFAFGNTLKTTVVAGKDNNTDVFGSTTATRNVNVVGANFGYGLAKDFNVTAGYYNFKDSNGVNLGTTAKDSVNVWEIGFDTKLSQDFGFKTAYGKSSADTKNKAYFAQLNYKGTDIKKVGSFGAWVNYRKLEANASPKATFDASYVKTVAAGATSDNSNGGKGFEFGFAYVPMTNALWKVQYVDIKSVDTVTETKNKFFQTQIELFF